MGTQIQLRLQEKKKHILIKLFHTIRSRETFKTLSAFKSDVSAAIVKHYWPIAAPALNLECFLFRIQLSIVFGQYLFNNLFLIEQPF